VAANAWRRNYHLAGFISRAATRRIAFRALQAYVEDAPKGEYIKEAKQLEMQIKSQP
jgi:hypothetical protein